jgi:DNA-binding transcriptional LysR family regulator
MTTNARLRALVELADAGSVHGAAERLVVSESAISSAISGLSAEVGVPLVDRHGRGIRLTPAGRRYVEYARRILGLHEEAVLAARGEADPEHGSIRLAAVTTAGELLIPALLASFRAKHPGVVCKLEVASRNFIWPMLSRHEADVIVAGRPPGDLRSAHIQAVSPNTLAVVGPPDVAPDFAPSEVTWLLREPGSGTRATTTALLYELGVSPPTMTLGSHGAVVAAAVAGLGVTLVSRPAVRRELDSALLVELPVPGTPMHRPWHIVTQSAPTGSTELLISHLLAHRELGWHTPSAHAVPVLARLQLGVASFDQPQDHRGEDELHREIHLPPGAHDRVRTGHEGVVEHCQKVGEVDSARIAEPDDEHGFVGRRYGSGNEGIRCVHDGDALEVDVGARELPADVVQVVGHPSQDGVGDVLGGVPADLLVPV